VWTGWHFIIYENLVDKSLVQNSLKRGYHDFKQLMYGVVCGTLGYVPAVNPMIVPKLFVLDTISCGVDVVVGNVIPLGFVYPAGNAVGTL
jgi:hypothetical protein